MPEFITSEARDLISLLLVPNPKKRLGYGPDGAKKIKEHPYFEGINWEDAWNKKLTPPFVPDLKGETDLRYFDKMFTNEKIESKVSEPPSSIENSDFKGFTYVTKSVSTELAEMKKSEEDN